MSGKMDGPEISIMGVNTTTPFTLTMRLKCVTNTEFQLCV